MSTDEKNIGRRAFLGMVVVGILALFLGKEFFPRIPGGGGSPGPGETGASGIPAGFRINRLGF